MQNLLVFGAVGETTNPSCCSPCAATGYSQMGVRGRGEGGGGSGGSVGGCPRDGDATSCRQSRVMEHFFLCVQNL